MLWLAVPRVAAGAAAAAASEQPRTREKLVCMGFQQ
jgi:hypothetical protein